MGVLRVTENAEGMNCGEGRGRRTRLVTYLNARPVEFRYFCFVWKTSVSSIIQMVNLTVIRGANCRCWVCCCGWGNLNLRRKGERGSVSGLWEGAILSLHQLYLLNQISV